MDYFPIFLDLRGRRCVVLGAGAAAEAKAAQLARAGADIVAAAEFAPALLDGVSLVIVAGAARDMAEAASRAAQARAIPVNVMDEPALCSFIMPAVVERSPVTVAIATDGAAPALAGLLREWLERALPEHLGLLAVLAGRFRPLVRRHIPDFAERRLFWRRILTGNPGVVALAGDEPAAETELKRALDETRRRRNVAAA